MNDDDLILIERYLKDELSDSEKESVESRAENDTSFAREIALQKDMFHGIESHFDNKIKNLLAETEHNMQKEAKVVQPNFWISRGLPMAAAIIVFMMVGYLLIKEKPTGQELFISYYETYPNIVTPLDRSSGTGSNTALSYYENGDFQQALSLLEKEILASPEDIGLQFYFGICQLEVGNIDFAITELKSISDANSEIFSEPATWYLALAYLRANKLAEAKNTLRSIQEMKNNAYQKRATKLLEEMD